MDWKKYQRYINFLTVLLMVACSNTNSTTPAPPDPTEIVVSTTSPIIPLSPTTISSDTPSAMLCANPHYPVREGATWTYQSIGSPADDYRFTDTISSVRKDGFTLETDYEKFRRSQEWACSPDGLLALQLGGPIVAALESQAIHLDLEFKNGSGITLPHNIAAGDRWQQTLELQGDLNIAGEAGTASGVAQFNCSALDVEHVSVPAGDFDAIKIKVDSLVNLNVTYDGLTVPVTHTAAYTYWFAPDIGWVKASGQANLAEQSFTENIVLQSYSIP